MTCHKYKLQTLLSAVEQIARDAGNIIMQVYQQDFDVHYKADQSPLTEADIQASEYIEAALSQLTPGIPFLSEESEPVPYAQRALWQDYWLVDPLDGTRSFINKNDEFTVNIALVSDHQPVLGVVYAPVARVNYYAAEGVGAFKREANGVVLSIQSRALAEPPVIAGNRSCSGLMQTFLANVGAHELVVMSSSLKICLVAEGQIDLYARFWPTSEWDTAAGHAIVNASGGSLVDTRMQPLRYNTRDSLLNPHFFVQGHHRRDWSRFIPAAARED